MFCFISQQRGVGIRDCLNIMLFCGANHTIISKFRFDYMGLYHCRFPFQALIRETAGDMDGGMKEKKFQSSGPPSLSAKLPCRFQRPEKYQTTDSVSPTVQPTAIP